MITYTTTSPSGNPITISVGNTIIGKVYQEFESDLPQYTAIDSEGQHLATSSEWSDIEAAFEKHRREFEDAARLVEDERWAEEISKREEELQTIRRTKKQMQITKSLNQFAT